MSASGQYQIASYSGDYVTLSTNYGTSWSTAILLDNLASQIYGIAMSASGQYITAGVANGYMYTSYNSINSQGVINVGGYSGTISGVTGIAGSIFYDTSTSTMRYSNGSAWNEFSSSSGYTSIFSSVVRATGFTTGGNVIASGGFYSSTVHSTGFTTGGSIIASSGTINGTLNATTFNATSDYRVKENVQNIDLNQYNVNNLRPVSYVNKLLNKRDIGFIAHEVQEEFPFLVSGNKDDESYQSLNYTGLIGVAIQEIKDLKEQTKKMNHLLELNEKLVSLGDIDLCGNYLTNIEGFHFMDGTIQNTGYNTTTQTSTDSNVDIYEIKKNNHYINKSPGGFITWNIYVDNFSQSHDGTIFYFINSTGNTQDFYFNGETKLILYDIDNSKLDVTNRITIDSTRVKILYTNNGTPQVEMYILNK
jgi:hypothetical protein